jgi:2-oxoacid:acceptor oxidoreductase gamma subunit (pyruvate/2-ketoisovalerate family)
MVGIRFYGRGGQGAVVASKILANAYFKQGLYVQAFPSIVERGEIKHPTSVIVLDSSLLNKVDITQGAPSGALILLNCKRQENHLKTEGSFRFAGVDAVRIALEHGLGSRMAPIINTVILGAYARVSGDLALPNLLEAIEKSIPASTKQNMAAAEAAYGAVFKLSGDVDAA